MANLKIWRGNGDAGEYRDYDVEAGVGWVVLDAVHRIQDTEAPDLAVRWNCKAGKCGSCSAEINGQPRLMCMTRLEDCEPGEPITVAPMKAYPNVKDLVSDTSRTFQFHASVPAMRAVAPDRRNVQQMDVDRSQEFRKCIQCFLCNDVCHVLREHDLQDKFAGPAMFTFAAALEMNPLDEDDRLEWLRSEAGIGYCNITKCCTEVCPEGIKITDNAIIPLKERVADRFYDPVRILARMVAGWFGRS